VTGDVEEQHQMVTLLVHQQKDIEINLIVLLMQNETVIAK
jgi:hypothetical protein